MTSSVMVKSTIVLRCLFGCFEDLSYQGASGVILGCTEIGLLIDQSHTHLPVLDTTALHAQIFVDFAPRP